MTMSNIIYRPVPGYDDLYAGSDGSIVHGGKGRELKQSRHSRGYRVVHIPNQKQALVHRLVAAAFLGPCEPGMEVRHADGTRTNNQIDNLCYGTTRDNAQDAMRHGTHQGVKMLEKTECPQGHPYSSENTRIEPKTGRRRCRICERASYKRCMEDPERRARKNQMNLARYHRNKELSFIGYHHLEHH